MYPWRKVSAICRNFISYRLDIYLRDKTVATLLALFGNMNTLLTYLNVPTAFEVSYLYR
ncbi:hypothetical protein SAMN05216412_10282 [Nitrosospira multiformis]|uniref:Uncharacterized protein n=1 Tax=Nitrosospira multiformis TaxID=1231 RepID=A0A1I0A2R6_9PROT|nr:hypothetical protein SAMN05216412_10282 [Nitrosospira multiformis]